VNASATDTATDTAFDAAMRARWHSAQARVSSATTAQLHRRRIAASTGEGNARAARRFGWPLAAVACAVSILAIGLFVTGPQVAPDSEAAAPAVSVAESADGFSSIEVLDAFAAINLTALDEDPEFLLWLASDEARAMLAEAPSLVMQ